MAPEENTTETVDPADTETVDATQDTTGGTDLAAELEDVRRALKKANREAADRRKQLEQYEQAEKDRQQAELSELEKAQARIAEMEARARDAEAARDRMVKERAFYTHIESASYQFANEQARNDAIRLIDVSEMDDDEIADAVKRLYKERPYLFRSADLPDTDGQRRGGESKRSAFEEKVEAARRRYNIRE